MHVQTGLVTESEITPQLRSTPSLYRVVWRWHFYAGVFIAPILFLVTITGALYVFKDELEPVLYQSVMFVEPQSLRISLDAQLEKAKAHATKGYRATRITVTTDPRRATSISFQQKGYPFFEMFVNPHTGVVQGQLSTGEFFRVVQRLHRSLLLGTSGRIVVEMVTGWTIVLLLTGLYLWWPRRGFVLPGVLVPRLHAKPYVILRDLHALAGFYALPIALVMAITGLVYTKVWGSGFFYAANQTGAFASWKTTPKSKSPAEASLVSLDEIAKTGWEQYGHADQLLIELPDNLGEAIIINPIGNTGPIVQGSLTLDHHTGAVLSNVPLEQTPVMEQWHRWNYPLHVGSVLGMPTKILWFVACLVLLALPVTGLWMWWKRRPTGGTGFPRRPAQSLPWWLIGSITLLGALLPVVGTTIAVILLGEWVAGKTRFIYFSA